MFKIFILLTIPFFFSACKKSENNSNRSALLGLLLLNKSTSLGVGSQTLADYFGDSSSLTSEDSVELGAAGFYWLVFVLIVLQ